MQRSAVIPMMLLLTLALTGCERVRARAELKQGNEYYAKEQYRAALKQFQKGLEMDPDATFAWRSVGLTALALYQPGNTTPENVGFAETAIDAFEKYLETNPESENREKVQDYLLTTYVNAKKYDEALAYIEQQQRSRPNDPQLLSYRVRILVQADRLDEAMRLAMQQTGEGKAESLYSIGVASWNKSYNDPSLNVEARTRVVDTGMTAMKTAIDTKRDYAQAMAFYNLLLREKAKLETDAMKRQEYMTEALEWARKAGELNKRQAAREAAEAKKQAQTES
jgi:tetratricopeptide (TPR) repeat protein